MKKIYLLFLALGMAGYCAAQVEATGATINNWDGSTRDNPNATLNMMVGEKKALNYTLEPANADPNSVQIEITCNDAQAIVRDNDGLLNGICSGTCTVKIVKVSDNSLLTSVRVQAYYYSMQLYDDGRQEGQVWVTLDANNKLQFWAEYIDRVKDPASTASYNIPDFEPNVTGGDKAYFWLEPGVRNKISEIDLSNIDTIGKNNFQNMLGLRFLNIPDNVKHLKDSVFFGSTNLNTVQVNRYIMTFEPYITTTAGTSFLLAEHQGEPVYPKVLIINHTDPDAVTAYSVPSVYFDNAEWLQIGTHTANQGEIGEMQAHWMVNQSDSLGTLRLQIENDWSLADPTALAKILDRKDGDKFPWDALGSNVQDLQISGKVSYIGKGAFSELTGLQRIQFNQHDHPLDSIHIAAFHTDIRPWKFAFGDPFDGPITPPEIIGWSMDAEAALHFLDSTVLYVPDSLVDDGHGGKIKCIDLYRNAPFWGSAFNRITDRTVAIDEVEASSVELSWLPLENATGYKLTITKKDCQANCDTSLIIPAFGIKGLIDWAKIELEHLIPSYIAARRAPKGDDGQGGMTLTISIQTNSGSEHNSDAAVKVTGLKSKSEYDYTREVLKSGKLVDPTLTKTGSFETPDKAPTAIDQITNHQSQITNIYDLLGRSVGLSLENLPEGIYIIDNGATRTKIMLRR